MYFIEDFKEGDQIIGHYLCKNKQQLTTKAGKKYLSLMLSDKTGMIDSKVWEINHNIKNFEQNDVIKVDGEVIFYQDHLQLKIYKIRPSVEGEYSPEHYIPTIDKDIEDLFDQVLQIIQSVNNSYLHDLLLYVFVENKEISERFKTHSAARSMHHSVMGGLLEHTVSVVDICEFLAPKYKFVNRDLLVTAALLHDIGKVFELSSFPENDYTDVGQLLGHIVISLEIISDGIRGIPDFPEELGNLLRHCLISHHGAYEYGSPKLPKTMEAFILSAADNLDAKVTMMEEALAGNSTSETWAGYHRALQRNIRKTDNSLKY